MSITAISVRNSKTVFQYNRYAKQTSITFRGTMDDDVKQLLQRVIREIPTRKLKTTLSKWSDLTVAQLQSLDFNKSRWTITETLLDICEKTHLTTKHVTTLEMIYVIDNPNHGMWQTFQLMDPEEDTHTVELMLFKKKFKSLLGQLVRPVSVKIKKNIDDAVWIRIAWGDGTSQINHLEPTYVVLHLQSPYVFVNKLTSKQKHSLTTALVQSTSYQAMEDVNFRGQKLTDIMDLVMKQHQQVCPRPLRKSQPISNPRIVREQEDLEAKRLRLACEAFGDGVLPQLQFASYKMSTKFKDHANSTMTNREEPFRCAVKFMSTNLLESLKHCASSGIASTPVTPLLSYIPEKGRNYFVITDSSRGVSSQTHEPQN